MMNQRIKYFISLIVIIFGLNTGFAQIRQAEIQTTSRLALSYYNDNDYEKAAPLLLEAYHLSHNSYYFRLYLSSLIEIERSGEAIEQIKKEISNQNQENPEFYIHWGYVLKEQKQNKEAEEKYTQALEMIDPAKGSYLTAANSFLQWQEYEWAKKVYEKGREVLPGEHFYYELARANLYLKNYTRMLEEYLNLIRMDETQLNRVQSALSTALRLDADNTLRSGFRTQIIKRIQAEPSVVSYNRLLIWFFLQEQQFSGALRQAIALDRRTGQEEMYIYQLGQMALNNKMYGDAERAFNYLIKKGEDNMFYIPAYVQNLHASYLRFTTGSPEEQTDGRQLAENFKNGLNLLGSHSGTLSLINDYAHLLAFYLNEADSAIAVLGQALQTPGLRPEEAGLLKTQMADIHVFVDDPWEATLLYSQVIDANKNNTLGDEVKLKKARLAYLMGNFSWAKVQLDVLKASTSKLTANDAMDLSMLIGSNLNIDSTAIPLQMFARSDMLFFRNKETEAIATLDSIAELYPHHSLTDNILYRKASIEIDRNNYATAAGYLVDITDNYSYGLLADDALFMLAELYNYNLNEKEKAKELYREMLTRHPGSVFTEESREKFRELRKIYPDVLTSPQEELIIQDSIPYEAN